VWTLSCRSKLKQLILERSIGRADGYPGDELRPGLSSFALQSQAPIMLRSSCSLQSNTCLGGSTSSASMSGVQHTQPLTARGLDFEASTIAIPSSMSGTPINKAIATRDGP
jgi:hypothetical protein